jgi:hypothetical protein
MFILLTRGLKGLQSAVQFRRLIDNLQLLALQHYGRNLQQRAFDSIAWYREKKRSQVMLVLKGRQFTKNFLMKRALF